MECAQVLVSALEPIRVLREKRTTSKSQCSSIHPEHGSELVQDMIRNLGE
jgi:hypothetical protein